MGPKKRASSKKAALSPNIAYLNTEMANLGVDLSGAGSSSQYQTSLPQMEQDLSAMSPLGNFDLTSVERAMLLLGSHETDLATSGLVPDLNLSDGKFFAHQTSYVSLARLKLSGCFKHLAQKQTSARSIDIPNLTLFPWTWRSNAITR
jgi:hypothetical protein